MLLEEARHEHARIGLAIRMLRLSPLGELSMVGAERGQDLHQLREALRQL